MANLVSIKLLAVGIDELAKVLIGLQIPDDQVMVRQSLFAVRHQPALTARQLKKIGKNPALSDTEKMEKVQGVMADCQGILKAEKP